MPAPGRDRVRYGGNTPCVEVICGKRRVILDSGTGLRTVGEALPHGKPLHLDMIMTHYHWDHVQGFPFFWPIYDRRNSLRIHGLATSDVSPRDALSHHMSGPVFPVQIGMLPSKLYFNAVRPGQEIDLGEIRVYTAPNIHPGGCLGLRIEHKGKVFVHLTDNECPGAGSPKFHRPSLELARGADLVSFDVTFTEDEYHGKIDGVSRHGWGHAHDAYGVAFAEECRAKRFLFFHHDPEHDDAFLDKMAGVVRAASPRVFMSVDGLEVEIPEDKSRNPRFRYPIGGRPKYPPPGK